MQHGKYDVGWVQLRVGNAKVYVVGKRFKKFSDYKRTVAKAKANDLGMWGTADARVLASPRARTRAVLALRPFDARTVAGGALRRHDRSAADPVRSPAPTLRG